uniref:Uncharacterized protein n=1 Tax=Sphaerodactylus townsendi TaxID=933632 RepID=A0ACB8EYH8_9SAUR
MGSLFLEGEEASSFVAAGQAKRLWQARRTFATAAGARRSGLKCPLGTGSQRFSQSLLLLLLQGASPREAAMGPPRKLWLGVLVCWGTLRLLEANEDARLFDTLFANYDKSRRPVRQAEEVVEVSIKLTLTNLISLNEKEETLTTNVWITQEWHDYRLDYASEDFGGVSALQVPADQVWLPDIVLENNIDGQFEVAYFSNVLIYPGGYMYWLPPAIFRSTCSIAVTFFPFDWQNCSLVFRSQTYNADEVQLTFGLDDDGNPLQAVHIDPEAFTENGERAIQSNRPRPKKVLAAGIEGPPATQRCTSSPSSSLAASLHHQHHHPLRAHLLPGVPRLLPARRGGSPLGEGGGADSVGWGLRKCTASIPVLLAQTVFLFLIAQKVPGTRRSACPPLAKPACPKNLWEKCSEVFLEVLPRYLGSTLEPAGEDPWDAPQARRRSSFGIMLKAEEYILKKPRSELLFERQGQRHGLQRGPGCRMTREEGAENGASFQSFADLPHRPLLVELTVEEGQRLKVIYGSCAGFHAIDVDSGNTYDIYIPVHIQSQISPHAIIFLPNTEGMEMLLCYEDEGVYVNTYGRIIKDVVLQWGEMPTSVAYICSNQIMGWGEKAIEIRSVETGHLDGVFMHKRAQRLKFLCERNDKVFFASVRSGGSSQVYFMTLNRNCIMNW